LELVGAHPLNQVLQYLRTAALDRNQLDAFGLYQAAQEAKLEHCCPPDAQAVLGWRQEAGPFAWQQEEP
jgi:hypothetical protein